MSSSYSRPSASSEAGTTYKGSPHVGLLNSSLRLDDRPFDTLHHEMEIHVPQPVLPFEGFRDLKEPLIDCLDMPVRLADSDTYYFPEDWSPLFPHLQNIVDVEHSNNPRWREYYTYLTVHYTPYLEPGEAQRHGGCHTDGFQGARVSERTITSRSYVAVTNGGTKYFPQTFVAGLDASKFNVFEGFDLQVEKDDRGNPVYEEAQEEQFYFFDAYAVHEAGSANRPGDRLFVRLTWEWKLFDRSINTKNSMMDYNWKPVEYDIRDQLETPTWDDIEAARRVTR